LLGEEISFNQSCYGLTPKNGIDEFFLFLSLKYAINLMKAISYGTVFDTITIKNFEEMKTVIAPSPILNKFSSLVESLFQKTLLNHKQIIYLRKVRDTLLPLLVFGRVRVEEV
jgi:type I restriction enzyme S subunit